MTEPKKGCSTCGKQTGNNPKAYACVECINKEELVNYEPKKDCIHKYTNSDGTDGCVLNKYHYEKCENYKPKPVADKPAITDSSNITIAKYGEQYTCGRCHKTFLKNKVAMSCLVIHADGVCCHYGDKEVADKPDEYEKARKELINCACNDYALVEVLANRYCDVILAEGERRRTAEIVKAIEAMENWVNKNSEKGLMKRESDGIKSGSSWLTRHNVIEQLNELKSAIENKQ